MKAWTRIFFLALGIPLLSAPLPAATEAMQGSVVFLDGELALNRSTRSGAEAEWESGSLASTFGSGDRLRTGRESRAELELMSDNRVRLAPETLLEVEELLKEGQDDLAEARLTLAEGEIWAELDNLDGEEDIFQIDSGLAGAAITGTAFSLSLQGSGEERQCRLKVWHGEVRLSNQPEKLDQLPARKIGALTEDPRPVPGPTPVPGPRPVSLDEWLVIVGKMQEIVVAADGSILREGEFRREAFAEEADWLKAPPGTTPKAGESR